MTSGTASKTCFTKCLLHHTFSAGAPWRPLVVFVSLAQRRVLRGHTTAIWRQTNQLRVFVCTEDSSLATAHDFYGHWPLIDGELTTFRRHEIPYTAATRKRMRGTTAHKPTLRSSLTQHVLTG